MGYWTPKLAYLIIELIENTSQENMVAIVL